MSAKNVALNDFFDAMKQLLHPVNGFSSTFAAVNFITNQT